MVGRNRRYGASFEACRVRMLCTQMDRSGATLDYACPLVRPVAAAAAILTAVAMLGACGGSSKSTPVLGRQVPGTFSGSLSNTGLGRVRPSLIDTGGTADSEVFRIAWTSWGDKQAIGAGEWCPGGQPCGAVRIVAFNLGPCDGIVMYRAVEWYFTQKQVDPGYPHSFDPKSYRDICAGTIVEGPG